MVRPGDHERRKRLAEHLLRHPFSLQKITWNATTKTVIYRSKRHDNTKRNFEMFSAPDFSAAALLHLPPKGHSTVRYHGIHSNRAREGTRRTTRSHAAPPTKPPAPVAAQRPAPIALARDSRTKQIPSSIPKAASPAPRPTENPGSCASGGAWSRGRGKRRSAPAPRHCRATSRKRRASACLPCGNRRSRASASGARVRAWVGR